MACPFSNPKTLFQDLATARDTPGLVYSEQLGGYVVTRYDDIISVLERPDVFSSRPTVPEFPDPVKGLLANKVPEKGTLLAHDNPDHDRLRKSVASFFVPRRLGRFEPLLIATAHELIDAFVQDGSVEVKSHFALPLPLKSIIKVAGLDPARWEWIGRSLALFGGITGTDQELSIQQRVQDVLDLHEYVSQVIEDRRTDRKDDLISHIWDQRDAGVVQMSDFEHLSMIPGLLLAGHETTTNLLSMGLSHLLEHGLWEEISQSDEIRIAAIEELLRYESAITGMQRVVKEDTQIGGNNVKSGDILFVSYNSGSRDASRFDEPDRLDPRRRSQTQHLGFGRGVHACLGAPFARLLLRVELSVLWERLPNLRLESSYRNIQYHPIGAGRGPTAVRIAWDPPPPGISTARSRKPVSGPGEQSMQVLDHKMIVTSISDVAERVKLVTLKVPSGGEVPRWAPGAHIDIKLGSSNFRQYSLCSSPDDRFHLQFAVQEKNKTGVSHLQNLKEGGTVTIRGPRNNFTFEAGARKTFFVAGGIGITPILPMAEKAKSLGLDYEVIYLGRQRSTLAFLDHLESMHGSGFTPWITSERNGERFNFEQLFKTEDYDSLRVYCCGPEELLTALENELDSAPLDTLRTERFQADSTVGTAENHAFEVVLARSGKRIQVPADRSVLDMINEAGAGVMSTCNEGLCGTCEVKVLGGLPEHRDSVLTPVERASGKTMISCVSRCKGSKLMLDLW